MADRAKMERVLAGLRGLRSTAARSRMADAEDEGGQPAPSLTIVLGLQPPEGPAHDPDAEDWDKVDDDEPEFPGVGPQERKRRREP